MSRPSAKAAPAVVVVSYCTKCGRPIMADLPDDVGSTSCPTCPVTSRDRSGPRIDYAEYRLAPHTRRKPS